MLPRAKNFDFMSYEIKQTNEVRLFLKLHSIDEKQLVNKEQEMRAPLFAPLFYFLLLSATSNA